MENNNEKKRMTWDFTTLGVENPFLAVVTMPSGHSFEMDMQPLYDNTEMRARMFTHGCKQKISDAIAGFTGSDADKADLMQTLYLQLREGEWSTRREAQPSIDVKKLRADLIANGVPESVADGIIENSKKEKKAKK